MICVECISVSFCKLTLELCFLCFGPVSVTMQKCTRGLLEKKSKKPDFPIQTLVLLPERSL